MPRLPWEGIRENENTCPYWVRGPVYRMLTVIFGCGGYGEVTRNHPAAGTQITEDVNGPYICKRCHGCGMWIPTRQGVG